VRLFVAIDLDDGVRRAVADLQRRIASGLKSDRPPRWVGAGQMHLTLAFLGEIAEPTVPAIVKAISANLEVSPFSAVFERLGVFPSHGSPRVLWLGISEGADHLLRVQQEVVRRLQLCSVQLEQRRFQPHLTLARWRESPRARASDARRALAADPQRPVARATVDHVTLYQSRLSPAGPSYTALARANLT
jgi:2'-5' RNA ligase